MNRTESLDNLRETLRTRKIRAGINASAFMLTSFVLAEGTGLVGKAELALAAALSFGAVVHDVMDVHTIGQEVAARSAEFEAASRPAIVGQDPTG